MSAPEPFNSTTRRATGSRFARFVGPASLLTVFVVLASTSITRKSITFDELGHLTGGYTSWVVGDHRMFPQNGQFPKRWATLPLLFQNVSLPPTDRPEWWHSDIDQFGYQFLYTQGNDLHFMLRSCRTMTILLGVLLAVAVYVWSRNLFGVPGATVSLTLCALSPTILAHSRLATSDIAATLMFTVALYLIWSVMHKVTVPRVIACACAVGLLCISKMSGLLIVPVVAALGLIRLLRRLPLIVVLRGRTRFIRSTPRQLPYLSAVLATVVAGAWLIVWMSYGFRYTTFRGFEPGRDRMLSGESIDSLTGNDFTGAMIRYARNKRLLPEAYLFGVAHVLLHSRAHPAFLNGEYSLHGWKLFFPETVLRKTPLPLFLMIGLAGWAFVQRTRRSEFSRRLAKAAYRTAPLWIFLAVYWAVAVRVHLSIGHRHMLPTYPPMLILCGAAGDWFRTQSRVRYLVIGTLFWFTFESLAIWPHDLAYFNQIGGGPQRAYRHLVDSSLDWGQDLPGLKQWLDDRARSPSAKQSVYLSYFGTGDPAYYGVDAELLPGYIDFNRHATARQLRPGIYCISATMLQSVYTLGGPWNRQYEQMYRNLLATLTGKSNDSRSAQTAPDIAARWRAFEYLRLARLCAWLRQREPDDQVGYSILIYHISEADLQTAVGVD